MTFCLVNTKGNNPNPNVPLVESSLTLSLFTEHDAVNIMHSVLDPIDYLHHSIALKYVFLSFPSSRHLLNRPRQCHCHCLLWHVSSLSFLPTFCSSFHRAKLLYSFDKQLTFLTLSFNYVVPKVIKNTGNNGKPVDIQWTV